MWRTNLAIVLTVLGTLGVYTAVANIIPQVESEVPEELVLSAEATPEELVAAGEELYAGAGGCTACHGLGTRAPDLLGVVGSVCEERVPGQSCEEYLHESLVEPQAYVVEGFQPIMPDMRRTLSETQIWALVAFLQSQGGQVTVTAEELAAAGAETPAGVAEGAAKAAPAPGVAGSGPREVIRAAGCLTCHVLNGEGGPVGPPLDGVGTRLTPAQIRQAILYPNADTTAGYEAFAGTMPATFGEQLTAAQLEAVVRFLAERQ